mmetsp:Transcript_98032/g.285949  ORF Transcript_98032/g.285949 Transcript_98032/m.285949 type:complete len:211 (+) Transcript_98032:893-1525(+)
MSEMRPLTLPKTSPPSRDAPRSAAAAREASWASAGECCLRARSRMRRTASNWARPAEEVSCVRPSWTKEAWLSPYTAFSAPPVLSWMICFALVMAWISSLRLFVAASKSCAFVRQSLWRSARARVSTARSFVVTWRSPSAVALFSLLFASAFFESAMSLFAKLISSSKDCFSIWKLFSAAVSLFLASDCCASAFASRPSSVETMSLLWLS